MDIPLLEKLLSEICKKPARIAVLGIGNYLRADDFLGVAIVQNIKERVQKDSLLLLEAEIAPTEFFHVIQEWNPTYLIVIDAADFKAKPGTINLIEREQIKNFTLSSHKRALTLLFDFISVYLPDLNLIILGVQPAIIDFEIGLSQPVKDTVEKLSDLLVSIFSSL